MIMPTPKPNEMWKYVVRRYNYETGEHAVIQEFEHKEEAHFRVRELREHDRDKPFNYEYEKVEKGRPDLHHERLKEEWGYKK